MLRNFQHPPGSGRLRSFIASTEAASAVASYVCPVDEAASFAEGVLVALAAR
jgi:hypothetical protein